MAVACFADRLLEAIETRRSHVVLGFDPDYHLLPAEVRNAHPRGAYDSDEEMKAACYRQFLLGVLESVAVEAVAVKLQVAYFEALGAAGYRLYEDLVGPCRDSGLLVIGDVKRGDIGSTAEAYAQAHLEKADVDAVTVNPYLGRDSLEPFLRRVRDKGKGIFVLVKTSNPSSADIQDLELKSGAALYARVARLVNEWGNGTEGERGYRSVERWSEAPTQGKAPYCEPTCPGCPCWCQATGPKARLPMTWRVCSMTTAPVPLSTPLGPSSTRTRRLRICPGERRPIARRCR